MKRYNIWYEHIRNVDIVDRKPSVAMEIPKITLAGFLKIGIDLFVTLRDSQKMVAMETKVTEKLPFWVRVIFLFLWS